MDARDQNKLQKLNLVDGRCLMLLLLVSPHSLTQVPAATETKREFSREAHHSDAPKRLPSTDQGCVPKQGSTAATSARTAPRNHRSSVRERRSASSGPCGLALRVPAGTNRLIPELVQISEPARRVCVGIRGADSPYQELRGNWRTIFTVRAGLSEPITAGSDHVPLNSRSFKAL